MPAVPVPPILNKQRGGVVAPGRPSRRPSARPSSATKVRNAPATSSSGERKSGLVLGESMIVHNNYSTVVPREDRDYAWVQLTKGDASWTLAPVLDIRNVGSRQVVTVQVFNAPSRGASQAASSPTSRIQRQFFIEDVCFLQPPVQNVAQSQTPHTLHTLEKRLTEGSCYTWLGDRSILSLNPFTAPVLRDRVLSDFLFQAVSRSVATSGDTTTIVLQGVAGSGKSSNFGLLIEELSRGHPSARGSMLFREAKRVLNFFGNIRTVRNRDSNRYCHMASAHGVTLLDTDKEDDSSSAPKIGIAGGSHTCALFEAARIDARNPGDSTFHVIKSFFAYLKLLDALHEPVYKKKHIQGISDEYIPQQAKTGTSTAQLPPQGGGPPQIAGIANPPSNVPDGVSQGNAQSEFLHHHVQLGAGDPNKTLCVDASLEARLAFSPNEITHDQLLGCIAAADRDLGSLDLESLYMLPEAGYRFLHPTEMEDQFPISRAHTTSDSISRNELLLAARFIDMRRLLEQFGVGTKVLNQILTVLNVTLSLGNVEFRRGTAEGAAHLTDRGKAAVEDLAMLLGLSMNAEVLEEVFLIEAYDPKHLDEEIELDREDAGNIHKARDVLSACRIRDELAAALYKSVFNFIEDTLNDAIAKYDMADSREEIVKRVLDAKNKKSRSGASEVAPLLGGGQGTTSRRRSSAEDRAVDDDDDEDDPNAVRASPTLDKKKGEGEADGSADLQGEDENPRSQQQPTTASSHITSTTNAIEQLQLLDGFGFEALQYNSLEQFLRNYAVEKLRGVFETACADLWTKDLRDDVLTMENENNEALAQAFTFAPNEHDPRHTNAGLLKFLEDGLIPELIEDSTTRNMRPLGWNLSKIADMPGDFTFGHGVIEKENAPGTDPNEKRTSGGRGSVEGRNVAIEEPYSARSTGSNASTSSTTHALHRRTWRSHLTDKIDKQFLARLDDVYSEYNTRKKLSETSTVSAAMLTGDGPPETAEYVTAVPTRSQFVIHHSAGDVSYSTEGFLVQNCPLATSAAESLHDILIETQPQLVTVGGVLENFLEDCGSERTSIKPVTKSSHFRRELGIMMDRVTKTPSSRMYFVQCVKPNFSKRPLNFESTMVQRQLRGLAVPGLQELIRSIYDIKVPIAVFLRKYRYLLEDHFATAVGKKVKEDDAGRSGKRIVTGKLLQQVDAELALAASQKSQKGPIEREEALILAQGLCEKIMEEHFFPLSVDDEYVIGRNYVFMRAGPALDNLNRASCYINGTLYLQSWARSRAIQKKMHLIDPPMGEAIVSSHNRQKIAISPEMKKEWRAMYLATKEHLRKKHVTEAKTFFGSLLAVLAEEERRGASMRTPTTGEQPQPLDNSGQKQLSIPLFTIAWQRAASRLMRVFDETFPDNRNDFCNRETTEDLCLEMEKMAAMLREAASGPGLQSVINPSIDDDDDEDEDTATAANNSKSVTMSEARYNAIAHALAPFVDLGELKAQAFAQLKHVREDMKNRRTMKQGNVADDSTKKDNEQKKTDADTIEEAHDMLLDFAAEAQHLLVHVETIDVSDETEERRPLEVVNERNLSFYPDFRSKTEVAACASRVQFLLNACVFNFSSGSTNAKASKTARLTGEWKLRQELAKQNMHFHEARKQLKELTMSVNDDVDALQLDAGVSRTQAPRAVRDILAGEGLQLVQMAQRNLTRFIPVCTTNEALEVTGELLTPVMAEELRRLYAWKKRAIQLIRWRKLGRGYYN
ncbi:unnamed protein product [Amoebophrya sp. A25]|nr:unnamed protein product [Amoebophrya sp. A25]|eukprot:GSA25T00008734001.1